MAIFDMVCVCCILCWKQAVAEKEKGNAAYKKKDFATAHSHYDRAWELDPKNITILTNKAGTYAISMQFFMYFKYLFLTVYSYCLCCSKRNPDILILCIKILSYTL